MKKILIVLLLTLNLCAETEDFEAFVIEQTANKTPPSASVAVTQNNQITYIKSFGYNDANKTEATTPQSVYHIYSLTKILTATVVMQLIEEGKIGIHDSIKKIFSTL